MILHIGRHTHQTIGFAEYLKKKESVNDHLVVFLLSRNEKSISNGYLGIKFFFKSFFLFFKSNKVIIHGLSDWFVVSLIFQPWIWKKCHWIIWGWDLYRFREVKSIFVDRSIKNITFNILEKMRRVVIPRFGCYISCVDDDFKLADKQYGLRGKQFFSPVYPSNFAPILNFEKKKKNSKKSSILVGNSASKESRHLEMFKMLSEFKEIDVFVPLSYGDEFYAQKVIAEGELKFGDSFNPILDFMNPADYTDFLNSIDIVCFGHKRQQGVGNLVKLIGLGKKVFLDVETTTYKFFSKRGIKVFDINSMSLDEMTVKDQSNNIDIIQEIFSEKNVWNGLEELFSTNRIGPNE